MVWNAIADTVLSGTQRQQELKSEEESEYLQWQNKLATEIRVFIKQVNQIDFSKVEDRDKFSQLKKLGIRANRIER